MSKWPVLRYVTYRDDHPADQDFCWQKQNRYTAKAFIFYEGWEVAQLLEWMRKWCADNLSGEVDFSGTTSFLIMYLTEVRDGLVVELAFKGSRISH